MGNTAFSGLPPPEPTGPSWVFEDEHLQAADEEFYTPSACVHETADVKGNSTSSMTHAGISPAETMASQTQPDGYIFNVGNYRRSDIITRKPETAEWFHRGMNWMFGFHHEHAISCFRKSLQIEPDFCMAWWAIALCHGPNYNVHQNNGYFELSKQEDGFPSQKRAYEAIIKAHEFRRNANREGRALIEALRIRCIWPASDFAPLLLEPYSQAMRLVFHDYRNDAEVACLFVDSLMQLSPWQLYDRHTGQQAPQTSEINDILLGALDQFPRHPGILHLYIHLKEMSPDPEVALPMTNILRDPNEVPDLGHLKHMPTHIDMLVGHYLEAVQASEHAVRANLRYIKYAHEVGEDYFLYIGYVAHDFHMYVYAAMMAGMEEVSRKQALALRGFIEDSVSIHRTRAVDLDLFHAVFFHVLIRFGAWEEILQQDFHPDVEAFCASNTTLRYARGLAFAALGKCQNARDEQSIFEKMRPVESVRVRVLHNNKSEHLLAVNSAMLEGEILYREEKFESAFSHLRRAAHLEESLAYDEPWGQMQPIRHALGALLLEQNRIQEAEEVYRADLARYPNNIWALTGLRDCLRKQVSKSSGQLHQEIESIEAALEEGLKTADVKVAHSCACAGRSSCSSSSSCLAPKSSI